MNKRTLKLGAYVVGAIGAAFFGYRLFLQKRLVYRGQDGQIQSFRRPLSNEDAARVTNDCALSRASLENKALLIRVLYEDGHQDLAMICQGSAVSFP